MVVLVEAFLPASEVICSFVYSKLSATKSWQNSDVNCYCLRMCELGNYFLHFDPLMFQLITY